MRRILARIIAVSLAVLAMSAVPGPALAGPGAPVVALSLDIPSPDGLAGWWRTSPETFAVSDQDSVLHWDWGSGEQTRAVTAGSITSVGFAPEGVSTLVVTAVNAAEETSTAAIRGYQVDSIAPEQPAGLVSSVVDGAVQLTWEAPAESGSGLAAYAVYRNTVGPPFSESDRLDTVGTTSYTDESAGDVSWFYAVRALDVAGNDSLMSEAVRTSTDVTPPTAPGDLQAWLNGAGFVRVSWKAGYDAGSGVASYVILRALPGQEATVVATVPAGITYWDDDDLYAVGEDCTYSVFALDRAGNASAVTGPVGRGVDTTAPGVSGMRAIAALSGQWWELHLIPPAFEFAWTPVPDAGSDVLAYQVAYGTDPAHPSWTRTTEEATISVNPAVEWADWWFSVRAEDRAGNVSPWTAPVEQRAATFDEVAGADRVSTAVLASAATFDTATDVVVASSRGFPDGLAASSLAGTVRGPVLLVPLGPLRSDVTAELKRLGAKNAWVIGGPSSVSDETFASLDAALSGTVTRIAGSDRYATAALVAGKVRTLRGKAPSRIIVVCGQNFPDALSAGPLAYRTGWPLVFVTSKAVPTPSRDVIASSGATATLILGSTASVWSGVEALVPAPERLSGSDRYDTAARAAGWGVAHGVLTPARPVLTTGLNFPDGLSAGPFAGERGAPVLLSRTDYLPAIAGAWLSAEGAQVRRITALGATMRTSDVYVQAWRAPQIH